MRFRDGFMILSVTNNEANLPNAMVELFAGPLNVQDAIGNPTAEHAGGNACVVSSQDNVGKSKRGLERSCLKLGAQNRRSPR